MLSLDRYRTQADLDCANLQVKIAVLTLWIELYSRAQAQANPGKSWSSEVQNTAGSEPQQEITEDAPHADKSFDQTSGDETLAPSP
jgi:hypothetical protein